ncbi:hypothetical protein [Halolamina sediminis]|jgi:hypothetical protein|uniref:hypothetical protein n=1 Tax=Halolamina sediminis TaxID=1480675 RepID=UPI0006B448AF|nr:hypothetical protein [Halolamina sediminis]
MNGKHVAIAALVVVIALGGVAAALVTGFGPAPGGDEGSAGPSTPYENTVVVEDTEASGSDGSGDDGGDGGAAATEAPDPFTFVIEEITECGRTCRDVNGTITNQQDHTAEDVTIRSEIYTGGDMIWSGSSDAGDLASGESYSDQKRVGLSYSEAYKVQQNDGKIVIRTYVETADGTYVFKQTRTVA